MNECIKKFGCCGSRGSGAAGFTLVELLLVIFLVALVATLATVKLSGVMERAKERTAQADLVTLREAFVGSASMPGYLADMESIPGFSPAWLRIHNLLVGTNLVGRGMVLIDQLMPGSVGFADIAVFKAWSSESQRGWRGPYLAVGREVENAVAARRGLFPQPGDTRDGKDRTFAERGFFPSVVAGSGVPYAYGQGGEEAMADPWGNPYVLQVPPDDAFDWPVGWENAGFQLRKEEIRFRYARLVSAGPNGQLETPCYQFGSLSVGVRRELRLAGLVSSVAAKNRGDDLVLFLNRADIYEEEVSY
ncbi:MAG: prepilin-type N-terminal cleavage/methylation domain-containing protein [Lentisphaerae bacterium]|mgnify:CR=1 FL=1|nr:prepilin-type N-terminal cleavage/methylation domain-containing protein [Lentisphaerota bacterium]